MYDRLIGLYSLDKLEKLACKNVLLVGVGGVGSAVFELLIRSGIQNITIVDYDKYELSNLNRQLNSSEKVIGESKVGILRKHALDINPSINVNALDVFFDDNINLNFKKFDYVIDACDNIPAKVSLIKKCQVYQKKIICSLGVGNRLDPQKLEITTLNKTVNDPLGAKLRHELNKISFGDDVVVLSSSEKPIKKHPVSSYIGVSMTAGLLIGDHVLKELIS